MSTNDATNQKRLRIGKGFHSELLSKAHEQLDQVVPLLADVTKVLQEIEPMVVSDDAEMLDLQHRARRLVGRAEKVLKHWKSGTL